MESNHITSSPVKPGKEVGDVSSGGALASPMIKKCNACGGELRPIKEFVNWYYDAFVKMLGHEPKESTKFNCIICGLIYDEEFFNTGVRVDWWEALKKHYENEKAQTGK